MGLILFNEKIYQLSDIFRRVAFSQKSLDHKFLFNEYCALVKAYCSLEIFLYCSLI
jgi:hypothetical protein